MTKHYDILYKGLVAKTTSQEHKLTIFSLNSESITFSLAAKGIVRHCDRKLVQTEHPKLLIFEKTNEEFNNYLYQNDKVNDKNIVNFDLATYINSKFVYVERHIGMELNKIYINLIRKRCKLDQKVIRNSLALASLAPDEFALDIMEQPGYLDTIAKKLH